MDLESMMVCIADAAKSTRREYHLSIGGLLAELLKVDGDLSVKFDFGGSPCNFHSYRGYYEDMGIERCDKIITASEFIKSLKCAVGSSFAGWKGGDFEMDYDSILWCATEGNLGRAIAGTRVESGVVRIETVEMK